MWGGDVHCAPLPSSPHGSPEDAAFGDQCLDGWECQAGSQCTNACGTACTCIVGDPRHRPRHACMRWCDPGDGYWSCAIPVTGTPCDPERFPTNPDQGSACSFSLGNQPEDLGAWPAWIPAEQLSAGGNACSCVPSPDVEDTGSPRSHYWKCDFYQFTPRDSLCPPTSWSEPATSVRSYVGLPCDAAGLTCTYMESVCGDCALEPFRNLTEPRDARPSLRCTLRCGRNAAGDRVWACDVPTSDGGVGDGG